MSDEKLDKILEHIGSIDVTLAKQEVSLAEHIRRTAILETKLAPIEKHVNMTHGVYKFIVLLATVTGIITAITAYVRR